MEWHWFQPVLTADSKLGFLGPPQIEFGSNLVKVAKNLQEAQVWCKAVKKNRFVKVWTLFDLRLNLGLTRGILVILAEKGTSGAPMPERVMPCCSRCSHGPMERK